MKAEMKIETTVEMRMAVAEVQWLIVALENLPDWYSERNKEIKNEFSMIVRKAISHDGTTSTPCGPNVMFGAG